MAANESGIAIPAVSREKPLIPCTLIKKFLDVLLLDERVKLKADGCHL